jgi:hypothetical protein
VKPGDHLHADLAGIASLDVTIGPPIAVL